MGIDLLPIEIAANLLPLSFNTGKSKGRITILQNFYFDHSVFLVAYALNVGLLLACKSVFPVVDSL